ncbi:MAG TPA: glycoside hydrolase family 18 protein [Bryobacteraceae bacterium]|nr:glycoside hydrolase family 18 protein [Bryobacteraceae bacterium]
MRISSVFLAFIVCTLAHAARIPGRPEYEIVGYIFAHGGTLDGRAIAAKKMTRINYAFFGLKNGLIAERGEHDAQNVAVLTGLRSQNPRLQILISVGGGDVGSAGFSDMAITPEGRRRFVDSAVAAVEKYGLDGVDIDWEYPGYTHIPAVTVRPEDRDTYTLLLKELRQRFDREEKRLGRPLVTSSATGATQIWLDHTDMRAASKWLTTVNMMCYDWYYNDAKNTGHDSPLYTSAADPKHISIDDAVKMYRAAGVPAHKIVVGVPFYGRRWEGIASTNNGLWQPTSRDGSEVNFGNIEPLINQQGFRRFWDSTAAAPYLYNAQSKTFITYNDAEAEAARAEYVKKHHLGGIMFWEYTGDPRNTLLDAIDAALAHP